MFKKQAIINLLLILIPLLFVIFGIVKPYLEKREEAVNIQRQEAQKLPENSETRKESN
jgi:flagellar biosynthesis/type III secretory pathway M-ring protein FliF/YscJ